ncbi:MAG: VOC family protein, partial [Gammaproteobacteria bacterium]|nr:VOC family protein [Gammaproteobacteria bacterium]MBU2318643.1 VOC family protein [Gammaproteobacteria bacterium]
MFSHIYYGVSDFERAYGFYSKLMTCLAMQERFCDRDKPWAAWNSDTPDGRPLFVISKPFNSEAHDAGNGQMIAFSAKDRATVTAAYDLAIENGATCEGQPGLRSEYHESYFGAYFRDLDGNKVCVV